MVSIFCCVDFMNQHSFLLKNKMCLHWCTWWRKQFYFRIIPKPHKIALEYSDFYVKIVIAAQYLTTRPMSWILLDISCRDVGSEAFKYYLKQIMYKCICPLYECLPIKNHPKTKLKIEKEIFTLTRLWQHAQETFL